MSIRDLFYDIKTFRTKSFSSAGKFTSKRIKNLVKSYLAKNFGIVSQNIRPTTLFIETTRGCNFNCIMCRAGDFPKEYISFDRFKKTADMFSDSFFYSLMQRESLFEQRILQYAKIRFIKKFLHLRHFKLFNNKCRKIFGNSNR